MKHTKSTALNHKNTQKISTQETSIQEISIQEIREQLKDAVAILRLTPLKQNDIPIRWKSSWGDFKQVTNIVSTNTRRPIKRKATPFEISMMNFWIEQIITLPEASRRIVMARACGIPWRRLEEIDGRSHTTLRKIELDGLLTLQKKIPAQRTPPQKIKQDRLRTQKISPQIPIRILSKNKQ